MIRLLHRMRGPLTVFNRTSTVSSRHYSQALNKTKPTKYALLQRSEACNPLFVTFQKLSFHTSTSIFKEQEPELDSKHQMLIGFTCKVCNERSHHTMSKHSYTKGVVLIQCPGCKNRHLIADNLGWFKDSKTTVEDLVKEKGEAIRKIIVDDKGVERLGDLMEWLPEITQEEKIKKDEAKLKAEKLMKEQQQQTKKGEE
ncbi:DNL zinc finger-domain-containing protein [Parasitella parasitica]|nr:DNL zinc finger-domain-containing protein [Parasitella parasitica]